VQNAVTARKMGMEAAFIVINAQFEK